MSDYSATSVDWNYAPWDYCEVCSGLLMLHWRGRPCLQPPSSEAEHPAYIRTVGISKFPGATIYEETAAKEDRNAGSREIAGEHIQ